MQLIGSRLPKYVQRFKDASLSKRRDSEHGGDMAGGNMKPHTQKLFEVAYLGFSLLGSWLILRWALKQMDPHRDTKKQAKERSKQIAKRLGRQVVLEGQYEEIIAHAVVNPENIQETLEDVGGLEHIIDDLKRCVITPMLYPQYFNSSLLRQKRGVLLYGPPGTGKTMLAKALAKECGACFINLKASTMLSKWYGDSNKIVAAVWSLATKLQPTILFIDEVDSLLGARRSMEHEATTAMKTEFMQLWEGFETGHNNIVVLGATNKKEALDDAVLRRFSLQYEVKLPDVRQREAILRLTLLRHARDLGWDSVDCALLPPPRVPALEYRPSLAAGSGTTNGGDSSGDSSTTAANGGLNGKAWAAPDEMAVCERRGLRWLAEQTEGYSGSDLNELCSQAALMPIHAAIENRGRGQLEPLSAAHFERAIQQFTPPSRTAQAVQRQRQQQQQYADGGTLDLDPTVRALGELIARALSANGGSLPL